MARTDSFRVQHKEIAEIVGAIEKILSPTALATQADEVRKLLISLSGKLSVHLAMEDRSLYPSMISGTNAEAKKLAEEFMKEMGTLADAFKAYVNAWPNGDKIKSNPDTFCRETAGVFGALKQRVQREEAILYPAADRL